MPQLIQEKLGNGREFLDSFNADVEAFIAAKVAGDQIDFSHKETVVSEIMAGELRFLSSRKSRSTL